MIITVFTKNCIRSCVSYNLAVLWSIIKNFGDVQTTNTLWNTTRITRKITELKTSYLLY